MSVADWIILAFLVFSTVTAAWHGFFREAFQVAGLVVGYLAAAWQYRRLAEQFAPHLKSQWIGEVAAFLIIFFAVLILAGLAGRTAHWVMKKSGLTTIDRILGGVLGLLKGVLVVAVVLTAMAAFTPAAKWLAGSELAPYFLVGGRAAVWLAPSELRNRFYQGLDYLRKVHSEAGGIQAQPAGPSK
jgi:membrane protein required for colicin V production